MKIKFNVAKVNENINSNDDYCVYIHKRKDNNQMFYVGCGLTKVRPFMKEGKTEDWQKIVNTVGYTIEILQTTHTFEEALELEAFYIKEYGRIKNGGVLVNKNDGGTSNKGEDNYFYNRQLFGENNGNYGNKYGSNPLSKSIICLDINGILVKEYESISETELDGFVGSCVSNCCIKARKIHKNNQFIYKSEYNPLNNYKYERSLTSKRPVISFKLINNTLEFVKYYESARDTEKDGYNSKNVSACCNGSKKSHAKLIWIAFDKLSDEEQDQITTYLNDETNKI